MTIANPWPDTMARRSMPIDHNDDKWHPALHRRSRNQCFGNLNRIKGRPFSEVIANTPKFNATIIQVDNVYDRTIADYKNNSAMSQLLEAARIKEDLRNKEHDMWTY